MAFPAGVTTCNVTFGPYTDFAGNPLDGSVVFVPSTPLRYDGQALFTKAVEIKLVNGSGSIALPHVDQEGFDGDIGSVTLWTYRAVVRFRNRPELNPEPVNFQVFANQSTFDLENVVPVPASQGAVLPNLVTSNVLADEVAARQQAIASLATDLTGKTSFSYVDTAVQDLASAKVDKVTGKGLSANDYTNTDKTKVASVATGATANDTDANLRARTSHTGTQPISTVSGLQADLDAKATDIGNRVQKSELTVNVRDYGAVGDTQYMDQRVSSGTFGLADAVPQDAGTFGKCYTNSGFTTPATDNTVAFRAAFDALLVAGKFAFTQRSILTGNRALRKELYVPAGAYYISDAAGLFSLLRQSPSGLQAGLRIRGDGKRNTVLFVRITGSGANDFLFLDDNAFPGMELDGIAIVGCTGNERFIYHGSTGNTARWSCSNVSFKDYRDCITIGGTANADRWPVFACDFSTTVAGARLMVNSSNSQALSFEFVAPTITHFQGGDVFDIGAGGQIHIWGGSGEIAGQISDGAGGRLAKIAGAGLSDQLAPTMVVNDFKLELRADSALVDISDSVIVFRDCNIMNNGNTRWANGGKQHLVARHLGSVQYFGGIFGDLKIATSTSVIGDYPYGNRAHILIQDAWLKNQYLIHTETTFYTDASDGLTTVYDNTGTGGGVSIGKVQVEGCRPWGASYSGTLTAVNGSPNHEMTWGGRPTSVIRVTNRGSSARGLGLHGGTGVAAIVIPPRCTIVKVGIVKQAENVGVGSASRTWSLKDGNGTLLAQLTALGTDQWISVISAEMHRQVRTTNDRTFNLTCDTAGSSSTGCEGYFFVEYI